MNCHEINLNCPYLIVALFFRTTFFKFLYLSCNWATILGTNNPKLLNSSVSFTQHASLSFHIMESVFLFLMTCWYFRTNSTRNSSSLLLKLEFLFLFSSLLGSILNTRSMYRNKVKHNSTHETQIQFSILKKN